MVMAMAIVVGEYAAISVHARIAPTRTKTIPTTFTVRFIALPGYKTKNSPTIIIITGTRSALPFFSKKPLNDFEFIRFTP